MLKILAKNKILKDNKLLLIKKGQSIL